MLNHSYYRSSTESRFQGYNNNSKHFLQIILTLRSAITLCALQLKIRVVITMSLIIKLICVIVLIEISEAARILAVVPTPSISHQVVFRPLTQELARRGHEVVIITANPAFPKGEAPKNLTEIDVHDVSYKVWYEHFYTKASKSLDIPEQMRLIADGLYKTVDVQFNQTEVKDLLKSNTRFDLLILESCIKPILALAHFYKVPVIQVSSFGAVIGQYEMMGAPGHPFLFPYSTRKRIFNLTMWEKVKLLYDDYIMENSVKDIQDNALERMKKHVGSDLPSYEELYKKVDMLFLNEHPTWAENRPVPPSIKYIGGIHQNPQKELPEDLKSYLDSSKHGVIYMSFGTNVDPSALPPGKIQAFLNVFAKMPYDVLWKWNKDELPGRSENIRISKWLPQSDLLRHPNIKLFITQGGLQSTDEAITAAVPLIGVPLLADQWYNVEQYVHHGIGIKLDIETLNEDIVRNAVETVIGDKSYRDNAKKLRALTLDQPLTALQRAIFWTEHVIRHGGGRHLQSPSAHMNLYKYLEIDLIVTVCLVLVVALVVILSFVYWLVRLLGRSGKKKVL